MEERIKKVMANVFGIGPTTIDDGSSPDTIETWDSLHHMQMILALEQEFGVEFDDMKIAEMQSYPLVRLTLQELLG